jgi:hypothetical protein
VDKDFDHAIPEGTIFDLVDMVFLGPCTIWDVCQDKVHSSEVQAAGAVHDYLASNNNLDLETAFFHNLAALRSLYLEAPPNCHNAMAQYN